MVTGWLVASLGGCGGLDENSPPYWKALYTASGTLWGGEEI